MDYRSCNLCPRRCGADRTCGVGLCGGGRLARVAKAMRHLWEEPCICGETGTGAVFFAGCSLGCVYCQNRDISRGAVGAEYDAGALAELFRETAEGAASLDLVTPSHFAPQVKEALELWKPSVSVVYNLGGYELAESVARYMDVADVFLTDFKYGSAETGAKYSDAPDYPEMAEAALREMYRIAGDPVMGEDGVMRRGIVLRHLVLPGERRDSVKALERVAAVVPSDKVILSLMRQYTPDFAPAGYRNLSRRVTTFEYEYVMDAAVEMGFGGYGQDAGAASAAYTPEFFGNE